MIYPKQRNLAPFALIFLAVASISNVSAKAESPRLDSRFSDLKLPLGAGYDAVLGEVRVPSCIEVKKISTSCPDNICGSLQDTKLKADFATGFRQIHEVLDYDLSMDTSFAAKFEVFGGEGKSHMDFAKSGDKLTTEQNTQYVISAEKFFSSAFLDQYELRPQFKKMLDDGDYGDFREACGTHFVAAQTREGMGTLLFSADFIDKQTKDLFKTHFMSEFKGSFFNAIEGDAKLSANLKFSKEIIEKSGDVNFVFRGRGGDDTKTKLLSSTGVVREFGPLLDQFQAYLNSITAENSAIGKNYMSSYRVFEAEIPREFSSDTQVAFLEQILYMRMDISDYVDKVNENIELAEPVATLSDDYVPALKQILARLQSQDIRLSEMAKSCISDDTKCINSQLPAAVDLTKTFFLGDLIVGAEITPACQYKDGDLSVVKIGLNGSMPFQQYVYDIKIVWVSPDGTSGEVPFSANQNLTFGASGKFAMTLDTLRADTTLSPKDAANAMLSNLRDRYYIIKMSSSLLPIAKTYIMRSGVGNVNCPVSN